jgi:hypothetical protein
MTYWLRCLLKLAGAKLRSIRLAQSLNEQTAYCIRLRDELELARRGAVIIEQKKTKADAELRAAKVEFRFPRPRIAR